MMTFLSFFKVEALALSPDGTLLATGARDKDIVLSSLDVSLTEVDALPIEDQNEAAINYGATLWKKYTRKVMQRIISKYNQNTRQHHDSLIFITHCHLLISDGNLVPIVTGEPGTVEDEGDDSSQSSSNPKNTASLVGRAVHKTETRAKENAIEKEVIINVNEADKEAQPDGLLREQKARLRKSSRPDNPTSDGNVNGSTNELEEVRQQLRHVQLDSQKHNGYVNGHHHVDTNGNNCPVFVENGYDNSEISAKKNGYQSHGDSSSVSSSNYYGDIEDVAKEMYDLANHVEDARL